MGSIFDRGLPKVKRSFNGVNPIRREIMGVNQSLKVEKDHLEHNKKYKIQTLSFKDYPKMWSQNQNENILGSYFNSAKQISCPFILSFGFKVCKQERAKQTSLFKMQRAVKLSESGLAKFLPRAQQRATDMIFLYDKLEQGHLLVDTCHYLYLVIKMLQKKIYLGQNLYISL